MDWILTVVAQQPIAMLQELDEAVGRTRIKIGWEDVFRDREERLGVLLEVFDICSAALSAALG